MWLEVWDGGRGCITTPIISKSLRLGRGRIWLFCFTWPIYTSSSYSMSTKHRVTFTLCLLLSLHSRELCFWHLLCWVGRQGIAHVADWQAWTLMNCEIKCLLATDLWTYAQEERYILFLGMVNGSFCKWCLNRCPVLWHLLFRVTSVLFQYYQGPSLDAENDIRMLNVSLTTTRTSLTHCFVI